MLENEMMVLLDYGGANTADAEAAIRRAAKGGMVGGQQLRGLVAMLAGALWRVTRRCGGAVVWRQCWQPRQQHRA